LRSGNVLLDLNAARHLGTAMDRDGKLAQQGRTNEAVLSQLLSDPFFAKPPPKSTGRELFSAAWLDAATLENCPPADLQRTLIELTARTISDAIERWCGSAVDVIACGGGARNLCSCARLRQRSLPAVADFRRVWNPVRSGRSARLCLPARGFVRREPGAVPEVTERGGRRVLGSVVSGLKPPRRAWHQQKRAPARPGSHVRPNSSGRK
jgi:anhydro-N-acetylmuramic acid kinase